MVAMNRWGGEEKGNLITSLVAVGSLACGNNASGTKGSLCSASGRHIAKNTLAVMVIQVFWGSSDICQVPVWERARTPGQAVLRSCGVEQALARSHSQSSESGSAEQGKKGVNGTAHLLPGARLSVHASSSLELACPVCAAGRTSQGC